MHIVFEELEPVFSSDHALEEGALKVHEQGNLLYSREVVRGDMHKGFQESDVIVQEEFSTSLVEHAYLEPEAGVAYEKNGTIYIYTGGQDAHFFQTEIARVLGLENTESHKLRIVQTTTGGGFGGKIDISVQGILALLAGRSEKPLMYSYTREESFLCSPKRHPFKIKVKFTILTLDSTTIMDDQPKFAKDLYKIILRLENQ